MDVNTLEADFQAYRERGDVDALVRVFDAAAPRLLLLAAHLVARADEAEDLVQATFLAALRDARSYGGERPVLAWLAGILRHRALDLARRRSVRGEQSLADVDGLRELVAPERSPIDLAADSEAFERIAAAIATLEAPYRELLTLRLVHGLDPAAIAHARGANPSTVRVQLMRGLERLRAALPDPSALLGAGFAALVAGEHTRGLAAIRDQVLAEARALPTLAASSPVAAPAVVAGAAWKPVVTLVVVTVALLAALPLLWPTTPKLVVQPAVATNTSTALVEPAGPNATELVASGELEVREALPMPPEEESPRATPMTTVHGALLLHDGRPAVGVAIELSGSFTRPDYVEALEPPRRWEGATTTTDSNGAFALSFSDEYGGNFRVRSTSPVLPSAAWVVSGVEPGALVELGTCTLPPSMPLKGRIRRADGSLAQGRWNVYVTTHWSPPNFGEPVVDTLATVDAGAGEFEVAGIPLGPFEVSAFPENTPFAWLPYVRGMHAADAPGSFELVSDDVDHSERTTIHLVRGLVSNLAPVDINDIHLLTHDGLRAVAERVHSRLNQVFVDGLADGEYSLVVDDSRHVIEECPAIRPGTPTIARLRGSSDIELVVVDGETRAPIANWFLHVHDASGSRVLKWSGNWLKAKQSGSDGTTIFSTVPDPQRWTIEAEGYVRFEYERPSGFQPHTKERVEIELVRSETIAGRAWNVDGSPAVGALVVARVSDPARLEASPDEAAGDPAVRKSWIAWCRTHTDESGAFVLQLAEDSAHDVMLVLSSGEAPTVRNVKPGATDVELRFASSGRLEGTVVGADNLSRWKIEYEREQPESADDARPVRTLSRAPATRIAANGNFALEDLEPGRYALRVRAPQRVVVNSLGYTLVGSTAPVRELLVDVIAGQTARAEFDVGDATLGSIVVRVRDGDRPAAGLNVVALAPGFAPDVWSVADAALTDKAGEATLVRLAPGPWRVAVCPIDGAWRVEAPTGIELESGGSAEVEIAVEISTRRVRVLDEEGRPLAQHMFGIAGNYSNAIHTSNGSIAWPTDANGELTLTLTTGTHDVVGAWPWSGSREASVYAPTTLEWKADGPETIDVVLRRK